MAWSNRMELEKISLDSLDYNEALRYMGQQKPADGNLEQLMKHCETLVRKEAVPRYLYKVVPIRERENGVEIVGSNVFMRGEDIRQHLSGCEQAILLCATLSSGIDRLIRVAQKKDMAEALVIDALASVAVEQLGEKIGKMLEAKFPDYHITWRYGVGYGDFPIEQQKELLEILDAAKKIGVTITDSHMLTPVKSVNVVMGLTKGTAEKKSKSCKNCKLQGKCRFRQEGTYCYDTTNA